MKKFNKNIFVFVIVFLFIGFGFCRDFAISMTKSAKELVLNIKDGDFNSISDFTESVDSNSSKQLFYHDLLMDLNSAKNNLLNTKIIKKDHDTIVKTNSGTLVEPQGELSDKSIKAAVSRIKVLYTNTKLNGSEFLYVAAPSKGYGISLPANISDYRTSNYDKFIKELASQNIPTLDLTAKLMLEGKYNEDTFFITDHHWKPKIGFWSAGEICNVLNANYGFQFNNDYTNIDNFNIKTYKNWFLGSYGKKVGRYFTATGAEDIDIITPDFTTSFIEEQPFKKQVRVGKFEDTVMYMNHVETKDYYGKNPYAAYSGGDFRLQIVKNKLNPNGKKILLIRDSYACIVAPFLALNTSELHMLDVRDYSYFVGEKINVYEYIKKIDPDYVLVLYTGAAGVKGSSGKFDFE